MAKNSYELRVKVLSVWMIEEFEGQAILAGVEPRFVVALLIKDSDELYKAENSDVNFTVHRVVFFAINSIVKLFMESNVEGKEYDLTVETEIFNGNRFYFLRLASIG